VHCDVSITTATAFQQQIITDPLPRPDLLLLGTVPRMVQKDLVQKMAVLLDAGQMDRPLGVQTHSGSLNSTVYPVYFDEGSVSARQQLV